MNDDVIKNSIIEHTKQVYPSMSNRKSLYEILVEYNKIECNTTGIDCNINNIHTLSIEILLDRIYSCGYDDGYNS